MNNRQDDGEGRYGAIRDIEPGDLPDGTGLRPLSVEAGRVLRDEAVHELKDGPQARPWYAVVDEWRDWYDGYRRSHIEYVRDGETARAPLQNSYQPEYGKRYYAKLKDFERGVQRHYDGLTTVMLTLTASHRNDKDGWRCPADHMRDIMDGYDAARKQVHQVLSGRNWEFARVWEPHADGYGHLHLALFVEDDGGRADLCAEDFRPVMESHVRNCGPAGTEAHRVEGEDAAVSVNDDVQNLGSYISEYIGIFGEETLQRPVTEQMFYAVTWATGTRRVDFSNGAHELMSYEQFRRETGLRPEDRGSYERWRETGDPSGDPTSSSSWSVASICTVPAQTRQPTHADPSSGGADTTEIVGRSGVDPPPTRN